MHLMNRFSMLALAGLLMAGCDLMPVHTATKKAIVAHVSDTSLHVQTANGSVKVTRADREDVQIEARIRARTLERLDATKVVAERDDNGQLIVRVDWPQGKRLGGECRAA